MPSQRPDSPRFVKVGYLPVFLETKLSDFPRISGQFVDLIDDHIVVGDLITDVVRHVQHLKAQSVAVSVANDDLLALERLKMAVNRALRMVEFISQFSHADLIVCSDGIEDIERDLD